MVEERDWLAFAPLPGFSLPSWAGDEISLPGGVSIRALPSCCGAEQVYETMDLYAQGDLNLDTTHCLQFKYRAIAPAACSPLNGGTEKPVSWIAVASLRFFLVDLAFWLVGDPVFRFSYIHHVTDRGNENYECYPIATRSIHRRRSVAEEPLALLEQSTLAVAVDVCDSLLPMYEVRPWPTTAIAANLTLRALTSDEPLGILIAWVALEGLFGPDAAGETTYRLAQRISCFLESDPAAALAMSKRVSAAYALRSAIAHGLKSHKLKNGADPAADTYRFLRDSLRKILSSDSLVEKFNSSSRDGFLNEVVFRVL